MADAKLSELATDGTLTLASLFYAVLDPTGTPASKAKSLQALLTLFLANIDTDDITEGNAKFATAAQLTKVDFFTVTGAFDADAIKAKADFISVTQAVDLDAIETRVNGLDAAVVLKGTWDASAGTFPGSGSAQAGDSYIVSVGGTVDSVVFTAGDRIIAIVDNASATTYVANWHKADYTDAVLSVDGNTGAVDLSGTYEPKDATILKDADIGVTVQAHSAVLDATTASFLTADETKLDGIETAADVTDATNVAAAGAAMLGTADQTVSGGARVTTLDLGNLSGTTKTPDPGDRPIQKITNNGAGTIAPGTNQGAYLLVVKNTTGAGAITTSGWSKVSGDSFGTATTAEYLCHCTVVGDFSSMNIQEITA